METKSKKTVYLIVFIAFAVVVLAASAYAFYVNDIAFQDAEFNVNTTTAQESVFTASSSGTIAFKGTPKDVGQYSISTTPILTSNALIQVELSSSSDYETTQCTYDVVWNYTSSDMYTESDVELPHTTDKGTFPYELSIKINDNKEIDLSDFTWDNGKAIIMDDVVIASADLTKTTQVWDIVVNMYNIDAEQTRVFDKTFAANIEVVSNGCVTNEVAENTVHAYYFDTLSNSYIALDNIPSDGTLSTSKTMCVKGGTYTGTAISGDECYAVYDKEIIQPWTIAPGSVLATAIEEQGMLNATKKDGTWGIINENGYRYEGDDPNNYVCFGSEDTSCPADNVYRIIGAFNVEYDGNNDGTAETTGYLTKVQKNARYGGLTMVYHSTYSGTTLNSHYPNSQIYPTLNTTWHDSLSSTYQNQIASVNWNLGAVQNAYTTLPVGDFYSQERGTTLNTGVTESEKVFKIGMMYPSDYGYAVLSGNCARTTALYSYDGTANCYGLNWMHDATNHQWTMTAHITSSYSYVFDVFANGNIRDNDVSNLRAVRPAFYLNASVKVTGGSGTSADPYRISL